MKKLPSTILFIAVIAILPQEKWFHTWNHKFCAFPFLLFEEVKANK
jgi:hypothetical protein